MPYPALRGTFQLGNAAACLTALDSLRARLPVTAQDLRSGLLQAEVAGRFQVLPGRPLVILDVAHNPHAARALAANLASMPAGGRTLAVFGMLNDKDIDTVIEILKDRIDFWCIAGLELSAGARGATAGLLAEKLDAHGLAGKYSRHIGIAEAYAAARESAGENDRILVFGSFHTVAEILRLTESK